jgi:uncharacterized protein (DUF2147 family)
MTLTVTLRVLLLGFFVLGMPAGGFGAGGDAIVGLWNTPDNDAKIEIYRCGSEYCGRISYLEETTFPPDDEGGMAGLPKIDRYNPNPELRHRSLVGLTFLEGFRFAGDSAWESGRIYNPENGKIYKARISLTNQDRLMLRGYWGVSLLGRTETWVRSTTTRNAGA